MLLFIYQNSLPTGSGGNVRGQIRDPARGQNKVTGKLGPEII